MERGQCKVSAVSTEQRHFRADMCAGVLRIYTEAPQLLALPQKLLSEAHLNSADHLNYDCHPSPRVPLRCGPGLLA